MLRNSNSSSSGNRNGCLRLAGSGDFSGWTGRRLLRDAAASKRNGDGAFFKYKWQLIRPDLRHSRNCQSSLARSRALLRCVPDCRSARLGGTGGRSCTQQSGRGVAPAAAGERGGGTCAWHAAAAWPALSKTLLTKPPNTGIQKDEPKYAKYATATAKKMRVFRSVFDY